MNSVPPNTGAAGYDQDGRQTGRTGESRPYSGEDALMEVQLRGLAQLFEIGLAMAGAMGRVATAQAANVGEVKAFAGTDLALGFGRMTKAMGQIMLLQQETAKLRASHAERALKQFRRERKASAERAVREIAVEAEPGLKPQALKARLSDFFIRYDDYDDYRTGTFEEVVARICRDLGITPDPEMLRRVAEARAVDPAPPPTPPAEPPAWNEPPKRRPPDEEPYVVQTSAAGFRVRQPLDSPHLRPGGVGPP
jgi:hypothetical protein